MEPDSEFVVCRVSLIKWIANYTHVTRKNNENSGPSSFFVGHLQSTHGVSHEDDVSGDPSHSSLDSSKYFTYQHLYFVVVTYRLFKLFRYFYSNNGAR